MAYSEHYILSSNIHVFPCAYRSQNGDTIFDPEARLQTEKNLTHTGLIRTGEDDSYIISYKATPAGSEELCCVIGGYYFEIKGKAISALNTLYILLADKVISTGNTTQVLGSFESGTDDHLDRQDNDTKYYFTGLYFGSTAPSGVTNYIKLEVYKNNSINYEAFLPNIGSGQGHATNADRPNSIQQTPEDFKLDDDTPVTAGAFGDYAVSLNGKTRAEGKRTLAHGTRTRAIGDYSHAEGNNTLADAKNSHAEGLQTIASGENSHSEGSQTKATAAATHAEGTNTEATQESAHAEGANTKASGISSHAEGGSCIASGENSHAEGANTVASHNHSHAEGHYTKTGRAQQHVSGLYNIGRADTLFEIGNGTDDSHRSNAFEVHEDGTTKINGQLKLTYDSNDGGIIKADETTDGLINIIGNSEIFIEAIGADNNKSYIDILNDSILFKVNDGTSTTYQILSASDGGTASTPHTIATREWVNTDLTINGTKTFNGKITANNGLDITGADLTVGGADKFKVDAAGAVTAVSYSATSDKRLKENIIVYNTEKSILDLPIYRYDFINGPKNQIGCLAQDLQEICPELVNENENGYLSIQENKLIYLLIKEVKTLKQEIDKIKKDR